MLCDEKSYYPEKIDEMTFFQDVSLTTIEYMNKYQALLSKGDYLEANQYIDRQNGLYGYFACFFNMLENRIFELQKYLLQKVKVNPMIHQKEKPANATARTTVWTGGSIQRVPKYDIAPKDASNNWNYSLDGEHIILSYYSGSEKDVTVYANYEVNGTVYQTRLANSTDNHNNMSYDYMFCNNPKVETIKFNKGIDTSNLTNTADMFSGCFHLDSLDLSNLDTHNVTNMSGMFRDCTALTNLVLGSFDTENVVNMSGLFNNCRNLTTLDLRNFKTSNVIYMGGMFCDCQNLSNLNLSSFDTHNVINMSHMFDLCQNLSHLDLSSFDTCHVTDMSYMFYKTSKLKTIYVAQNIWSIQQGSCNVFGMFDNCGTSSVTYK